MSGQRVAVVGAGLTGCTVAHRLAQEGISSVLLERATVPGGLIRSEHMEGVLYEPHGSHIFHTEDREVWELANQMTPFRPYRHRVDILADGQVLNWPILLSDIHKQSRSEEILRQLEERRDVDAAARAQAANFEDWCLELMGPILYERFIQPYTEKQWGRPARELSASWAPRRVSVRWDNDPFLFPDPYQGWPSGPNGYTDLIDGLLDDPHITVRTGIDVSASNIADHLDALEVDAIVLTCPLDEFCDFELDRLEWRGILVRNVHIPHVDYAQGAMVVNYPGREFPLSACMRPSTRQASRSRGRCWASSSPAPRRAITPSKPSGTERSTIATRRTSASSWAKAVRSSPAAWRTTCTSTWTTACARRSMRRRRSRRFSASRREDVAAGITPTGAWRPG